MDRENTICLLVFAFQHHSEYPLIVAANRDEFYARPTRKAAWWDDYPQVFAGRDLEKNGTWLGVSSTGRFAALTNFRNGSAGRSEPKSRGHLVSRFLTGDEPAGQFVAEVERSAGDYDGFNLVVADRHSLHYCASRTNSAAKLAPGIYGISNHFLDTPWPKLTQAKRNFQLAVSVRQPSLPELFALLADASQAPENELPDTGVGIDWERKLSSIFIASPEYGTRASTIVLFHRDGGIRFCERSFGTNGEFLGEVDVTAELLR